VLERTPCFGTCAAYRLRVTRSGVVTFLSRNRGDSSRVARDSIAPDAVVQLLQAAERDDVFRLPAVIADDRALCPDRATDHPTAIVGFFWSTRVQQITDYHGCFLRSDHSTAAPLAALRQLEKAIDSVSGSARWTRANRFRGASSNSVVTCSDFERHPVNLRQLMSGVGAPIGCGEVSPGLVRGQGRGGGRLRRTCAAVGGCRTRHVAVAIEPTPVLIQCIRVRS
jgi:hypothetical protein